MKTIRRDALTGDAAERFGLYCFLAILAAGAAARLYNLGTPSMWLDEILVPINASHSVSFIFDRALTQDFHPPYYYLLIKGVMLFSESDFALRFLSALSGVASIVLMYFLAKKQFNQEIALLCCAFLSINALSIQLSRQVRPYSIILFFSIYSFYTFLDILYHPNRKNIYKLLLGNLPLTLLHFSCLLVPFSQGVILVILKLCKRSSLSLKNLSIFIAGSIALGCLSLFFLFGKTKGTNEGLPLDILQLSLRKLTEGVVSNPEIAAYAIIGALFTAGVFYLWRLNALKCAASVALLFIPLLTLAVFRYNSYFNSWHLAFLLPISILFLASGLQWALWNQKVAFILPVIVAVSGSSFYLFLRPDRYYEVESHTGIYKSLAAELPGVIDPKAFSLFTEPDEMSCAKWYLDRSATTLAPKNAFDASVEDAVPVDFVVFHEFGHLAKDEKEFKEKYGEPKRFRKNGHVAIYGYDFVSKKTEDITAFPFHREFRAEPKDFFSQVARFSGIAITPYFGCTIIPAKQNVPGEFSYILKNECPSEPVQISLVTRLTNPWKDNLITLRYAFDGEAPQTAFVSQGPDPSSMRVVLLKRSKPFQTVRLSYELASHSTKATFLENSNAMVAIKDVTVDVRPVKSERFTSSSLFVEKTNIGDPERDGDEIWAWGYGPQSDLRFTLPKAQSVHLHYSLNNPIPGQTVTVTFNGAEIATLRDLPSQKWLSAWEEGDFALEGKAGENLLRFSYAKWNQRSGDPSETFAPADGRPLTTAFGFLKLETNEANQEEFLLTPQPAGQ